MSVGFAPDSVHDGVIDSVGLSEKRAPDGGQWTKFGTFEDSSKIGDQIWRPGEEPEGNRHEGDLGQFALGASLGRFG